MKPHTIIYLKHFNISPGEFVPCEICQQKATDIHHIEARGMGGTTQPDDINNLMALCRLCHLCYGDISDLKPTLKKIHAKVLQHYNKYGTTQYQQ